MCYDEIARPPVSPIRPVGGAAANSGDIMLKASDGNELMAFFARASKPSGRGMVILPDVRGLHTFYKELAERFAEAGVDAVAVDYFGRTAGTGSRDEAFEFMPHVQQTTEAGVDADARAGAEYLRTPDGGAVKSVFTVGFCFGGGNSWRQSAANADAVDGCVGFYGVPSRVRQHIPQMKKPLLLLIAGQDHTPLAEFEKFNEELAGVEHEMQVYPNAPHSYFDRKQEQFTEECDDSWRRILAFMEKHG